MILICISLMTNDVEHLLMCLLAIGVTSFEKYLFRSSAQFLISFFLFFMLSCMNCLYILDINPLVVISFANILSHLAGGLLFCQWFPLLCKSV